MHLKTTGDAVSRRLSQGRQRRWAGGLSVRDADSRDWQTQVMIPACWVTAVRDRYQEPVAHVDWEVAACVWDLDSGKTTGDIS